MITKKEMDNILSDVNRVLSKYDERIIALEKEVAVLSKPAVKTQNKA